jgi:hypothetical protein
MPVSDIPLDGSQILRYLTQVADRLGPVGEQHTIIVVGGSLLALRDLRATTLDVDSVRKLSSELAQAVAAVGADNGLGPTWLNDNASMFTPATLRESDCQVDLVRGRLRVLGAPLDQVFLMKLSASRASDLDDLVRLWPHCGFTSAATVVHAY